jgi:hypothetical protein
MVVCRLAARGRSAFLPVQVVPLRGSVEAGTSGLKVETRRQSFLK